MTRQNIQQSVATAREPSELAFEDLPSVDMAGRVHGMDQILEGRYAWPRKGDAPPSKGFERADSLGERKVFALVSDDHDRLALRKAGGVQLFAVGHRASVLGVGREQVEKHVVIRLAVVAM